MPLRDKASDPPPGGVIVDTEGGAAFPGAQSLAGDHAHAHVVQGVTRSQSKASGFPRRAHKAP